MSVTAALVPKRGARIVLIGPRVPLMGGRKPLVDARLALAGPGFAPKPWPSAARATKIGPVPEPEPDDRRRKRSDDPLVALHYQLARAHRDGRLEAIVVADDSGLLVAGVGAWAACEELAAYAPLLAGPPAGAPAAGEPSRVAELRSEVDVRTVDVAGQTVVLCARGGLLPSEEMDRAAQGIARILASAA